MRRMLLVLLFVFLASACSAAPTGQVAEPEPASIQPTQPPAAAADAPAAPLVNEATPEPSPTETGRIEATETPMPVPIQPGDGVQPPVYGANLLAPPYGVVIDGQIDEAKQDLAQRIGIAGDIVAIDAVWAVTWPDGSLGCPQPGMAYPQVLVEGILVLFRANGQEYRYHGDGQQALFLCDPVSGPVGAPARPPRGEP